MISCHLCIFLKDKLGKRRRPWVVIAHLTELVFRITRSQELICFLEELLFYIHKLKVTLQKNTENNKTNYTVFENSRERIDQEKRNPPRAHVNNA